MSDTLHPAAPHHLPAFITPPGETDVLMTATIVFLVAIVLVVGNLYLRLHALPERMAHRGHKMQFEIVAVLALIALFTHNNLFWIAALLLALIRIPDFWTPLAIIAESQEKIASRLAPATEPEAASTAARQEEEPSVAPQQERSAATRQEERSIAAFGKKGPVAARQEEKV